MLVVGFLSFFLVPVAISQLSKLQTGEIIVQMDLLVTDLQSRLEGPLSKLGILDLDLKSTLRTNLSELLTTSLNIVPNLISIITNLVIVPFMMFFFIKDARVMKKRFIDI